MSEKKNIDKLFKEQFKDFEVAPNDAVWQRIEDELHKKKRKRRIIPIWWKVAGVAAVFALLFTIGSLISGKSGNTSTEQQVVDTNTENKTSDDIQPNEPSNEFLNPSNDSSSEDMGHQSIANQDNSTESENTKAEDVLNSTTEKNNQNPVVSTNTTHLEKQNSDTATNKNKSQVKDAIVNTTNRVSKQNTIENTIISTASQTKNSVAQQTTKDANSADEVSTTTQKKEQSEIDKLIKETKLATDTQVASTTPSEQDEAVTAIDTSATKDAIDEENAIEKAIADAKKEEEDTKDEEEDASKRWSVSPNVAPVYFNTLSKGSSLDQQFIENSKEGNVSVSYGVKGSYALNNKLKIRAGIHKVDLGYSTNNVLVFDDVNPNPGARQMPNVDVSNMQANSTYVSANSLSFGNAPEILNAKERGSIEQQLGFIEVPIELEYSLIDKAFGLNLIGGFSTLFLNNNELYSVENNGSRTLMGEATNIKDMSYSANFGVGVNYNISKQLQFNLEPTFKYQINTFNNTSGDFQPFFIGVYTGLSFKF